MRSLGRASVFTHGALAVSPTELSMPLGYPSTLDRGPAAASYVEGCWSPVLEQSL